METVEICVKIRYISICVTSIFQNNIYSSNIFYNVIIILHDVHIIYYTFIIYYIQQQINSCNNCLLLYLFNLKQCHNNWVLYDKKKNHVLQITLIYIFLF